MKLIAAMRKIFSKPYGTVSVPEAKTLLADGAVLIDVRSDTEWRSGHAPQARHVALDRLLDGSARLPEGRTIITVCQSGVRSATAARFLSDKGLGVHSLQGGMSAWLRANEPVTR